MRLTPIKTPKAVSNLFPNYVWNLKTEANEKVVYLTFDDGPTLEITDWTLDILKQYKAKATFFCIGNNVSKHLAIFKRIVSEGHAIGNHTHNHLKGWRTRTDNYLENTEKASEFITSKLFRPPYGQIRPKQGKALINLNYKIVMWSVLSFDWEQTISKEECLTNVIDNTQSGDIIVFHDSVKAAKNMQYVLPKVLEYYSSRGYKFKSIT